jgi:hypothetical protein
MDRHEAVRKFEHLMLKEADHGHEQRRNWSLWRAGLSL